MPEDRGSQRRVRPGMTKADLVDAVHHRHGGITKVEAAEIVETILDTVKSTLIDGRSVKIQNFGTFQVKRRPGRRGVNPKSGEHIFIPAHRGLSFRPAQHLKESVEPAEARVPRGGRRGSGSGE